MIIVTGGAGFIGSNIVHHLNKMGRTDIVIFDNFCDEQIKWKNLKGLLFDHFIFSGDDPQDSKSLEFLDQHVDEIDAIIHMGAISSTTVKQADLIVRNNLILSRYLWTWCAQHQKRFIYASSASTYGNGEKGFSDKQDFSYHQSLQPMNLYAWSKHQFDLWALTQVKEHKKTPAQWVGLKFFNVYGPREFHKHEGMSLVSKNFEAVRDGKVVNLFKSHNPDYKDGEQLRDFVYVGDCTSIISWFLEPENKNISGIFNVGTGKARSFRDLIEALGVAWNKDANINYVDMPDNIKNQYQYFTQAEMNSLRDAGYKKEFTSLEEGVKKTVEALRNS